MLYSDAKLKKKCLVKEKISKKSFYVIKLNKIEIKRINFKNSHNVNMRLQNNYLTNKK